MTIYTPLNGQAASAPLPAYHHADAWLADVLDLIHLRLERAVLRLRAVRGDQCQEGFLGLFLSDADIERILTELRNGRAETVSDLDQAIAMRTRQIAEAAAQAPVPQRPQQLASAFGLDGLALDLLLLLLAGELDARIRRVWAFLQDDVRLRELTPALACQLLPALCDLPEALASQQLRPYFDDEAPLRRFDLIDEALPERPWLERPLRLNERVLDALLGRERLPASLHGRIDVLPWPLPPHERPPRQQVPDTWQRLAHLPAPAALPVIWAYADGGDDWAPWLAHKRGQPLLRLPASVLARLDPDTCAQVLRSLRREQRLRRALISVYELERAHLPLAEQLCIHLDQDLLLHSAHPCPLELPGTLLECNLHPLPLHTWQRRWQQALPAAWLVHYAEAPREALLYRLAERYPLSRSRIQHLGQRFTALWQQGLNAPETELWRLCRDAAAQPMQQGTQPVSLRHQWDDLILPGPTRHLLRELLVRAQYQQQVLDAWNLQRLLPQKPGICGLFIGPSGTGKTLAASVIAHTLGLALHRIDLASVVSKYIGETEKNLQRIFDQAREARVVLFFDEADALFGKRSEVKDAHDRYANIETSYLLQQIEAYSGLCILASNFAQNIDEAFLRRIHVVVDFPLPGVDERLQLWQQVWRTDAPVDADLDLDLLARQFELTGGHIKNCLLLAACYAAEEHTAIGMTHLIRAIAREYTKLGKPVTRTLFGTYYAALKRGPA